MRVSYPTMQEMKAYTCEECTFAPKFKVHDTDDIGQARVRYLCTSHYHDLMQVQLKNQRSVHCEWCGNSNTPLKPTERLGESSGRIYSVCEVCFDRQEELLEEEFDDEPVDNEDPDDNPYLG